MLVVETIGRIRREHFVQGKTIKEIAARPEGLAQHGAESSALRRARRFPTSARCSRCRSWDDGGRHSIGFIGDECRSAARERLTLIRLFEELRARGYEGGYDAVRRYARSWAKEHASATASAFVPLTFAPGEAYQFDWSHEIVVLNGVTTIVKVAHVRLCHSRMLFVRAYPRETQEMVFDAHDRAFAFFKGACTRGIYDNMKTAVETMFIGKDRPYNRRFLQMCSHYLVEPVACTPASGWEKGQVENQVGLVRERFFTPRLRFKSYDELNAWLLDQCIAYAKAHRHPELRDQTIWEVFEAERPKLVPYRRPLRRLPRGAGLGLEDLPGALRQQQILGRAKRGRPAGRDPCLCRSHRDPPGRARSSANIARRFGRDQTIYDPWHYVPVLARKPGALRNGAPFKDWVLPSRLERVRRKLAGADDGDRQMVDILAAVLTDGLAAVEAACLAGAARRRPLRRRVPQYPGAAARARRPRPSCSPRTHCGCGTSRWPIAPVTTAEEGRPMERTEIST